MVEQKTYKKESVTSETTTVKRSGFSVVLYQFFLLAVGVVLTIWAFVAVSEHITDLKGGEYNRMSLSVADEIAQHFSNQEDALKNISSVLSMRGGASKSAVAKEIRASFSGFDDFEQIIWIFEGDNQALRYEALYSRGSEKRYGLNLDREFFEYIGHKGLLDVQEMSILTDVSFTMQSPAQTLGKDMRWAPFALSVPVKGAGAIIAVISPDPVFDTRWLERNTLVSQLSIRDLSSGHPVFTMDRADKTDKASKQKHFLYEFKVADRTWEVSMKLFRFPHADFLDVLPIFVLVLGCLGTALATLYVRIYTEQTERVDEVNEVLERKNLQLENEIAERERLNKALKKSEHDHRSIIDAVTDVIFETNADGQIVFLNDRWRAVTGFDPAKSKGMELFSMLHGDDQERFREDFRAMLQGVEDGFRSFTRLRTADGNFRAVELAISMVRKDENKDIRVVGTFTDVEDRRRAERALGEAEKKYRAIVENAAGGIFQITPEGLYLSANPALARTLGYESPDDLLRSVKNANEQVYASQRERQMFLKELEKHGYMHNYETRVISKNGDVLWINENARAVRDENMNTLYYEGSIADITVRKETDIQLREAKVHSDMANRAKSEFLANMSHELRTPLNSIIGFSEIIKNEAFGKVEPNAYLEYAKDIHDSGSKLLGVINEILDISKIEAGERQLNDNIVDINGVVLSCLELVQNKVETSGLNVTTDLSDIPDIVAEELAIKQVVMNLLSNAVKFTPDGGRVSITSGKDNQGRLTLSITDTGIGLDEDEIEKALSPFGQLQNELSRDNSGTGLGLTLARSLVELHGGELELFSEKGIGTTATIILPASRICVTKGEKPSANVSSKAGDQENA